MDIDKLRSVLSKYNTITKDTSKNFVCHCIYCSDHSDVRKRGHMYVSKDPEVPVVHCFICNFSTVLPKFITDLTGDRQVSESILPKAEFERSKKVSASRGTAQKLKQIEIPDLDVANFFWKNEYIQKRSGNVLSGSDIPKLIFNFKQFFRVNNLQHIVDEQLGPRGLDLIQNGYIGILTRNDSILYCRNTNERDSYKFRKIQIQTLGHNRLDYITMPGGDPKSKLIVAGEGPFDIIGEYSQDSLGLRDTCRMYICGLSFSYKSLIRSFCYDETLFNADLVILSDTDKKPYLYKKMKRECKCVLKSIKLFYNRNRGGDFGSLPITSVQSII
jgi:hypothetical protein